MSLEPHETEPAHHPTLIEIDHAVVLRLRPEAARRGITVSQLARDLLDRIADDDLTPAVMLDLVGRLEDLAVLLWFETPVSPDTEHQLVLELGRLRALEAASAICNSVSTWSRER